MKKNMFMGTLLVITMVLTALVAVPTADAKQNGNGIGNKGFPGNSLYGRMHNPNFMYKWGNLGFEDFDDLVEYIRQYLYTWKYERKICDDCNTHSTSTLINVITRTATNITEDGATLRGKITLDKDETAEVWFEYGTTTSNLNEETDKNEVEYGDSAYSEEKVTDLNPNTKYYYRAMAEDRNGVIDRGVIVYFTTDSEGTTEEAPNVVTRATDDITDDSAVLRGRVEMNDFDNGIVFFVYGTDEDMINDVNTEYDTYADIDESGDDLQKVQVDADLDGNASYTHSVDGLDGETHYFCRIGVQYVNEDNEDVLKLGGTRSFTTE